MSGLSHPAVISCVLAVALLAGAQRRSGALLISQAEAPRPAVPNLTGTWKLDRDLTTADLSRVKTDILVISQSFEQVRFSYYDHDRHQFGVEIFITDGEERPRYKTRIERAYARAGWKNNRLVVRTRSFLDIFGYQSYSFDESWERAADGSVLTNKSSDGKQMVYYRIDVREAPIEPSAEKK